MGARRSMHLPNEPHEPVGYKQARSRRQKAMERYWKSGSDGALKFCEDVFASKLIEDQRTFIKQVFDPKLRKIAWATGHGYGKGFTAGNLAAAFTLLKYNKTNPPLVVITAPTGRQAKGAPWDEMKRCVERMSTKAHRGRTIGATTYTFKMDNRDDMPGEKEWKIGGHRVAINFTIEPEQSSAFQGFHAKEILIIIDEASGVDDRIIKAAETLATGEKSTIVMLGNPTVSGNAFHRAFSPESGWTVMRSSCFNHPNVTSGREDIGGAVTRMWLVDQWNDQTVGDGQPLVFPSGPVTNWNCWKEYGRISQHKNPWWMGHVIAEFPADVTDRLIASSWVERAFLLDRGCEGDRYMGVDVARFGRDNTAICITTPTDALHLELHPITSGPQAVKLVRSAARDFNVDPRRVSVDATGMGGMGVVDWLQEFAKVPITGREQTFWKYCNGVEFASKAHQEERFTDRKTELLWNLRARLEHGTLGLKNLSPQIKDILRKQLTAIMYEIRGGRFAIESKDQYRKRAGHSPDAAEALALACWHWGERVKKEEGQTVEEVAESLGITITGGSISEAPMEVHVENGRRVSSKKLSESRPEEDEADDKELEQLLKDLEDDVDYSLQDDDNEGGPWSG